MPSGHLALVVSMHHRLPAAGAAAGRDWAVTAADTYWPLLRAVSAATDAGWSRVAALAISPAWSALASDPAATALVRRELDHRAEHADGEYWSEYYRDLRIFVRDHCEFDAVGLLRRAQERGTVELIPLAASYAWMPALADHPIFARAAVGLAALDHARTFGTPAQGFWLPMLSYRVGLERVLARFGLRYFGVDEDAFRRGSVQPPADVFAPLVSSAGVASFGVERRWNCWLGNATEPYAKDPRYAVPRLAKAAAAEHAKHFVSSWRDAANRSRHYPALKEPISLTEISAHDVGGEWPFGADWIRAVFQILGESPPDGWTASTPGFYLDHHPEGSLGRPGPAAGGMLAARPADSSLWDRCRDAAEVLEAVLHKTPDNPSSLQLRAVQQLTRSLLSAANLDWAIPPLFTLPPQVGLRHNESHLDRFAELAGLIAADRLEDRHLAPDEAGVPFLPAIPRLLLCER